MLSKLYSNGALNQSNINSQVNIASALNANKYVQNQTSIPPLEEKAESMRFKNNLESSPAFQLGRFLREKTEAVASSAISYFSSTSKTELSNNVYKTNQSDVRYPRPYGR